MRRIVFLFLLLVSLSYAAHAQTTLERLADGVVIHAPSSTVRVLLRSENAIEIISVPSSELPLPAPNVSPMLVSSPPQNVNWSLKEATDAWSIVAGQLTIQIDRHTSTVSFLRTSSGKSLLEEGGSPTSRQFTPQTINGEPLFSVMQEFAPGADEGLYGLGQHQAGVWNYRGSTVDLAQDNTEIAVPLMYSSRGYGFFWNSAAISRFNNSFPQKLYVSSRAAHAIDYIVLAGPTADDVIAQYRTLTGQAQMFPRWAFGYWQSKNRYASQAEILQIAEQYRQRKIPIDAIVVDWLWWKLAGSHEWRPEFSDPAAMFRQLHEEHFHVMLSVWPFFEPGSKNYADFASRNLLIPNPSLEFFFKPGIGVYDATSAEARSLYWSQIAKQLAPLGVDAWWQDTTEPETDDTEDNVVTKHMLASGNGALLANTYGLLSNSAVYEGQRKDAPSQRPFILSRSGTAGSQRNGTTLWSGDIFSTWTAFQRQIPAGLNMSLSGVPYWTTDIGGFLLGWDAQAKKLLAASTHDPAYQELYQRWFAYGAFCPIFRAHGTRDNNENEVWSYGPQAEATLTKFIRLRYRMLPYIYSLNAQINQESYTLMRPLVMDFGTDPRVLNIADEYMFGPAFLVAPITQPRMSDRSVYLPTGSAWFDFWDHSRHDGDCWVTAHADVDRIPLYIRAGSILLLGPEMQFATEHQPDPIEVQIYPGANGEFTLYEDENDGYGYEHGSAARIRLTWDDRSSTLTFHPREGSFPGMLAKRTFIVRRIDRKDSHEEHTIAYNGSPLTLTVK